MVGTINILLIVIDDDNVNAKETISNALLSSLDHGNLDVDVVIQRVLGGNSKESHSFGKTRMGQIGIGRGGQLPLLDHVGINIIGTIIMDMDAPVFIPKTHSESLFLTLQQFEQGTEFIIVPVGTKEEHDVSSHFPYLQWTALNREVPRKQDDVVTDVTDTDADHINHIVNDGLYVDKEPRYVPPLLET